MLSGKRNKNPFLMCENKFRKICCSIEVNLFDFKYLVNGLLWLVENTFSQFFFCCSLSVSIKRWHEIQYFFSAAARVFSAPAIVELHY